MRTLILDTGPLVALLDASDHLHRWSVDVFAKFDSPLLSCEAVVAEACYLLRSTRSAQDRVMELIQSGGLILHPTVSAETPAVRTLLNRYADQSMDLADACLVRLSELHPDCRVITTDSTDFTVYRRNARQVIPLISPPVK